MFFEIEFKKIIILFSTELSVKCLGGQDIKGKQPLSQDLTHHTEHSKKSYGMFHTNIKEPVTYKNKVQISLSVIGWDNVHTNYIVKKN